MQRRSALGVVVVATLLAATACSTSDFLDGGDSPLSSVVGTWQSVEHFQGGRSTLVVYPDGVVSAEQGSIQCSGKMDSFEIAYRLSLDCAFGVKIVQELQLSEDEQFLISTKDGSRMQRTSTS
jgi:hypothetical protein